MPIYEYQCKKCGSVSEEIIYLPNDPPETTTCNQCGETAPRILSPFKYYRIGRHGDKKWK